MPLQPIQPAIDERVCVRGDVTIHPSAAIASGVILQAGPNGRIEIAAGACVGMGAIVHSDCGVSIVGAGASLGAGVLAVGECSIGENACIGAATTLFNASVAPQAIVPPGSLIGDSSRQVELEAQPMPAPVPTVDPTVEEQAPPLAREPEPETEPEPEADLAPNPPESSEGEPDSSEPSSNGFQPQSSSTEIYGQVHVRRIFTSLFPNSPSAKKRSQEES